MWCCIGIGLCLLWLPFVRPHGVNTNLCTADRAFVAWRDDIPNDLWLRAPDPAQTGPDHYRHLRGQPRVLPPPLCYSKCHDGLASPLWVSPWTSTTTKLCASGFWFELVKSWRQLLRKNETSMLGRLLDTVLTHDLYIWVREECLASTQPHCLVPYRAATTGELERSVFGVSGSKGGVLLWEVEVQAANPGCLNAHVVSRSVDTCAWAPLRSWINHSRIIDTDESERIVFRGVTWLSTTTPRLFFIIFTQQTHQQTKSARPQLLRSSLVFVAPPEEATPPFWGENAFASEMKNADLHQDAFDRQSWFVYVSGL